MEEKKPYRVTAPTTYHKPGDVVWLNDDQVLAHHEPIRAPEPAPAPLMLEAPEHGDEA